MKVKILSFSTVLGLLALNVLLLTSSTASGNMQFTEIVCKWQNDECLNKTVREICVRDGDGNTCTCGDVTRSCP